MVSGAPWSLDEAHGPAYRGRESRILEALAGPRRAAFSRPRRSRIFEVSLFVPEAAQQACPPFDGFWRTTCPSGGPGGAPRRRAGRELDARRLALASGAAWLARRDG